MQVQSEDEGAEDMENASTVYFMLKRSRGSEIVSPVKGLYIRKIVVEAWVNVSNNQPNLVP